jgi:hypothetical protein
MFKKNPKVEEAPLRDDLLLFNPESAKFFMLNPTMAFVWRRCGELQSYQALAENLAVEFDGVDEAAAAADVLSAVNELMSLGLLTVDAP